VTNSQGRLSRNLMSLASKGIRKLSLGARLYAYKALSLVGHTNFVRFFVLTRSRTGSNLLLSYLDGHPNVFAEGEIFARLKGADPLVRLKSSFGRQPRRIKAKGFKIFYYHPLDAPADSLWNELTALQDIRVIHLTRENVLRTLLSRKIAGMKDAWTGTRFDPVGTETKQVELTVEELEEGFRQTREWEEAAAHRFRAHPILHVTYEELVGSPRKTFRRVLGFLDLEYCEPRTNLQQQHPERMRDLIRNFDELKKAFAASPWQKYFDDPPNA